ncbi:hypothetical protein K1719_040238 [Acacia pycnantha]|nr:hypothetical protein K1719_040238 [Acacia pycnantha]
MSGNLPPEIMIEILHRLPPKSLVRFTSVCKSWISLIKDHSFISDHLNRTVQPRNGNSFLLLQLHTDNYPKFYSLHSYNQQTNSFSSQRFSFPRQPQLYGYSTVVGTCNGLTNHVPQQPN